MPGVLQHQGFVYSLPCPRVSQEYNSNRVLCTLCPFRGCARSAIAIGFCVLFALSEGVLGVLQQQGFVYSLPFPRLSQEYNSNRVLCTLCSVRGFCVLFSMSECVQGVLQQQGFVYSLPCPRVCQEYYNNRVLCILFALSYQFGQSFIFNPWSFRDTHSTGCPKKHGNSVTNSISSF